ncbi:MAG: NADP-dependent oxidoreductase, partial [Pseudomonadota bacterium]
YCIAQSFRTKPCARQKRYNNTKPEPGPSNIINMIGRGVLAQGFIVSNYMHLSGEFVAEVAPLLAQEKITFRESVYEGLDKAGDAFIGLFHGDNFGKAVVRVGPDRLA